METNHDLGRNIRKPWTLSQNDLNLNLEPCDCYADRFGRKFWIAGVGVSMCFCTHKMAQFAVETAKYVIPTPAAAAAASGPRLRLWMVRLCLRVARLFLPVVRYTTVVCLYTCKHGGCYATVLCLHTCSHGGCHTTVVCLYTYTHGRC